MEAPGRYWIVIYPTSGGDVVAKFDGIDTVPDEIADYEGFVVAAVDDNSALTGKTVDWTGITESEKDRLRDHFPD